ncbi:MAG: DUF4037 domain-containing protein, partial [Lachnospiraceae bacterium]|nr:DUF4037 domain-containing protein [Lachnospiraceae bacterium]
MDVNSVLKELDGAFERADTIAAEQILRDGIAAAVSESDDGALLQLLNEYLGFLRETSRAEESYAIADRIRGLMDQMGLAGSIPYATSLLNIANAYRAGGRLDDSLSLYNETEKIYRNALPADSMLVASFYNNKALLLQEMSDLSGAIDCLGQALSIVETKNEPFEIAVTHANLANSYLGLSDYGHAMAEAEIATDLFNKNGILDAHTASALYSLGISLVKTGEASKGLAKLREAADLMERFLGKNEFWYRIQDAIKETEAVVKAHDADSVDSVGQSICVRGLNLARSFYEECFKPIIDRDFADFKDRIAVGLFGRGSDCYGYDDEDSRDHDWGPGFVVLTDPVTFEKIGSELTNAYDSLPKEYKGFKIAPTVSGHKRRGVFTIEEYFRELLGKYPITPDDFAIIPDYALSTAVNGKLFTDPEGTVTAIRDQLKKGYPEHILFLKVAEAASKASQCAQYNYSRMLKRGDKVTSVIMLA